MNCCMYVETASPGLSKRSTSEQGAQPSANDGTTTRDASLSTHSVLWRLQRSSPVYLPPVCCASLPPGSKVSVRRSGRLNLLQSREVPYTAVYTTYNCCCCGFHLGLRALPGVFGSKLCMFIHRGQNATIEPDQDKQTQKMGKRRTNTAVATAYARYLPMYVYLDKIYRHLRLNFPVVRKLLPPL